MYQKFGNLKKVTTFAKSHHWLVWSIQLLLLLPLLQAGKAISFCLNENVPFIETPESSQDGAKGSVFVSI